MAVQWFLVSMPFKKIETKDLKEGLIVYYTVGSKFSGQHVSGPFNITTKNGELHLENGQNVKLPITDFPNVTFYAMLTI